MKISTYKTLKLEKKKALISLLTLISLSLILSSCYKDTNSPFSITTEPENKSVLQSVSFWVATDTHYLDKNLQDGGQAFQNYVTGGDGKILPYSDEIAESLVYDIDQKKPSFIILSGDLTNNGEKSSHEQLTRKLKRIEDLGTSVYVIPGNHDLFNPWSRSFKGDQQIITESITDKDFTSMYGEFGYSEALSRDKETLSYMVEAAPNLWLLMIDSNQYDNNQNYGFPQTDGVIPSSTLSWIDDSVKLAAKEHVSIITVMHHNLLNHTSMDVTGFKLNNSQETMKVFRKNQLNLVLSGHIHMQDIRRSPSNLSSSQETPVYDIATSAMAVNPHQYGAMTFDPLSRTINYKSTSLNVEGWAKANGITDPNLLHFKTYAENTFVMDSFNKAMESLKESAFTESEKKSMAEVMSELNVRYFAGKTGNSAGDIKVKPGYKLWESLERGFLPAYIQSMAADKELNNTSLQLILNTQ